MTNLNLKFIIINNVIILLTADEIPSFFNLTFFLSIKERALFFLLGKFVNQSGDLTLPSLM